MAVTFLEPGGDATFGVATTIGFWGSLTGPPPVVNDFVHGAHQKSIKFRPGFLDVLKTPNGVLADAESRYSVYVYLNVLPSAPTSLLILQTANGVSTVVALRVTSSGVLQLWNAGVAQIGTDGATLSTGKWYRISLAYTITSSSVNRFELFVNGVSSISITNATVTTTSSSVLTLGNNSTNAAFDCRVSDIYVDNSNSLTDPGNIWVTAKRPFANGTTNGFTTQIGSGGASYGSGHAPQINERALNNANGWSMAGAGSAITEEYTIENLYEGDMPVSPDRIIDYMGWVDAKSLLSETGSIIVNGVSSNISLTSTEQIFTKFAASKAYPTGGAAIGIITATTLTTVSLYECGIIVAFIPTSPFFLKLLTRR